MDDFLGGCGCLFVVLIGLPIALLIGYGAIVLLFRYAFGIELPNPFDWLPPEWLEKLPTVEDAR